MRVREKKVKGGEGGKRRRNRSLVQFQRVDRKVGKQQGQLRKRREEKGHREGRQARKKRERR